MTRTFIQTNQFMREWELLGFKDSDLRRLELEIMKNPSAYPVIQGTGGLRKMRFSFESKGKRGGIRVCYVDFVLEESIYLITVYPKSKKDNLNESEKNDIKRAIEVLKDSLRRHHNE